MSTRAQAWSSASAHRPSPNLIIADSDSEVEEEEVVRKLVPRRFGRQQTHQYVISSATPTFAHSLVLARLSTSPTLLPQRIASLITSLTMVARVSMRATALFIEAILETCKHTTLVGFGLTRRALVAAVGSARALNFVNSRLDWGGNDGFGRRTNDAFLQVLDHYTNAGIYLVHHTFTLAELFALSGFYLTLGTLQTGFAAAEESVRMLDLLFGSTESSRALASIITLVRSELKEDPRFSLAERGVITSLTALTKTLTAFVCLQTATYKRTVREMRLRVVYDCTIVVEGEAERTFSLNTGAPLNRNQEADAPQEWNQGHERASSCDTIMTDVLSDLESLSRPRTRTSSINDESAEIVERLEQLCGSDDEIDQRETQDLPPEVLQAIREVQAGTLGDVKRLVRAPGVGFEVEVEETTTTTTTILRAVESENGAARTISRRTSERPALAAVVTAFSSPVEASELVDEEVQEDEWVEVLSMVSGDGDGAERALSEIPAAINGSVATMSRKNAIEHPVENRERLQLVLSTMTKKFTQKKRTIHRLDTQASRSSSPTRTLAYRSKSRERSGKARKRNTRQVEWHPAREEDDVEMSTPPAKSKSAGVFSAFSKAIKRTTSGDSLGSRAIFSTSRRSVNSSTTSVNISPPSISSSGTATPTPSQRGKEGDPLACNKPSRISRIPPPSSPIATPPPPTQLSSDPRSSLHPVLPDSDKSSPPRLRRKFSAQSMHSFRTSATTHTSTAPTEETEPKPGNFPHDHLVANLQVFMRYASASYGSTFLRILGMGKRDYNFPHTEIHANHHAFAHHVGIRSQDILLSSYTDPSPAFSNVQLSPIVNYVACDHASKTIVLACRGSLGLSDILVDLTCSYEAIHVEHGDKRGSYLVHSGMYGAATRLQRGTVHNTISDALTSYPSYGLVLCGHSLGGGVAALLSVIWSSPAAAFGEQEADRREMFGTKTQHPPISTPFVTSFSSGLPAGRPISCFTFGSPCVASLDLVKYCHGLVTSTVHNFDIVPTLSLGVLRDLKTMAMGLNSEKGTAEEIVGRVIGLHQERFMGRSGAPGGVNLDQAASLTDVSNEAKEVGLSLAELDAGRSSNRARDATYRDPSLLGPELSNDTELQDWLWSLVKTMRASNDNEKLYPPGNVYLVESWTVYVSHSEAESNSGQSTNAKVSRKEGRRVILRAIDNVEVRFSEPIFGRTMMSDHSPRSYEQAVDDLAAAVLA